jgi:hypothetical protein
LTDWLWFAIFFLKFGEFLIHLDKLLYETIFYIRWDKFRASGSTRMIFVILFYWYFKLFWRFLEEFWKIFHPNILIFKFRTLNESSNGRTGFFYLLLSIWKLHKSDWTFTDWPYLFTVDDNSIGYFAIGRNIRIAIWCIWKKFRRFRTQLTRYYQIPPIMSSKLLTVHQKTCVHW